MVQTDFCCSHCYVYIFKQTHNLHVLLKKHKLEIRSSFFLPSQIRLPFATYCFIEAVLSGASVRVSYTQQKSKKCAIQEIDNPFREKRLLFLSFHTPFSLILILLKIRDFNCMTCEMSFFFQQLCLWYVIYYCLYANI